MKNRFIKIFALFAIILCFDSCLLSDDVIDFGNGPIVVQFPNKSSSKNFLQDGSGAVYDYKVKIDYFGANGLPLDKDVTVQVEVDNTNSDYAREGVEFTIPNKQVIIPSGKNEGELLVKINSGALDSSNPKAMVLKLVSSSEEVSNNKSITRITLQAICESNLSGSYKYKTGRKRDVKITLIGDGVYRVSADDAFGKEFFFNISDICGKLKVVGGFLQDNGIPQSGTGSVDETTGEITIIYTAGSYLSNRKMVLEKK